jgi:hypothetical protein
VSDTDLTITLIVKADRDERCPIGGYHPRGCHHRNRTMITKTTKQAAAIILFTMTLIIIMETIMRMGVIRVVIIRNQGDSNVVPIIV